MADRVVTHDIPSVYEPSLFGTYSKKIGMWLFLMSDSLTFGALLYAYSYGRISTAGWPTPFHSESIVNATIMTAFLLTSSLTMVLAVRASVQKDAKAQTLWLLATIACGAGFVILHGMEQVDRRRHDAAVFPAGSRSRSERRIRQRGEDRPAISIHLLYVDRHAHAARHAGHRLSRRGRVAEEIHSHSCGALAHRVARDA